MLLLSLLIVTARCTNAGPGTPSAEQAALRVGFGLTDTKNVLSGIGAVSQRLTLEGLARIDEDGRPAPSLAESWTIGADGLSMKVHLRLGVKFHDGTPVNASAVIAALAVALPQYMGPAFSDVGAITAVTDAEIEIRFKRASPFLVEALEAPIEKPGSPGVGTGPYKLAGASAPNELRVNPDYYLGRPAINRVIMNAYPSVRAAWAELLRDQSDMVYEVGVDALDSLASSRNVSVFTYVRHYQYVLSVNTQSQALHSREVRRALNLAIDRDALVKDAFDGHAVPSTGLVWPQHWASGPDMARLSFDPGRAAKLLAASGHSVRFRCLVLTGLERVALVVKRQLEAVGVEMSIEEASVDGVLQAVGKHDFDAVLSDFVSGPNLFRPYEVWHSGAQMNPGGWGSPEVDAAFDRVRYAANDQEYKTAVEGLQKTFVEDPPGIFLAWGERARAVSNRFHVPAAEPGRDILTTLRLWRPATDEKLASLN